MKHVIGVAAWAFCGCVGAPGALAADVPRPSADDTRIRVVPYQPQNVTKVFVRRGVVTRIILEQNERIQMSALPGPPAAVKALRLAI